MSDFRKPFEVKPPEEKPEKFELSKTDSTANIKSVEHYLNNTNAKEGQSFSLDEIKILYNVSDLSLLRQLLINSARVGILWKSEGVNFILDKFKSSQPILKYNKEYLTGILEKLSGIPSFNPEAFTTNSLIKSLGINESPAESICSYLVRLGLAVEIKIPGKRGGQKKYQLVKKSNEQTS